MVRSGTPWRTHGRLAARAPPKRCIARMPTRYIIVSLRSRSSQVGWLVDKRSAQRVGGDRFAKSLTNHWAAAPQRFVSTLCPDPLAYSNRHSACASAPSWPLYASGVVKDNIGIALVRCMSGIYHRSANHSKRLPTKARQALLRSNVCLSC